MKHWIKRMWCRIWHGAAGAEQRTSDLEWVCSECKLPIREEIWG